MKKAVTILLLCLATALLTPALHAQSKHHAHPEQAHPEHKHNGRVFAGGAVSFWADTDDQSLSFEFCPEVGYLFNDTWGVGVLLGYEYEQEGAGSSAGVRPTVNAFKISPFARYYYLHKGPFNLYLDGGFGLNFIQSKVGNAVSKGNGFEIGVRPGACVDLTEGLCMCLRMGFIGYRNSYFMGEEPGLGSTGFGFRFAPEELQIGLELEF